MGNASANPARSAASVKQSPNNRSKLAAAFGNGGRFFLLANLIRLALDCVPVSLRDYFAGRLARGGLNSRRPKPGNLLTIFTDGELFPARLVA